MIILYTSLIFSCVYLGVLQARKLSLRETFYGDMLGFLKAFHSNISFVQKNYTEITKEFISSGASVEFSRLLNAKLENKPCSLDFLTLRETKEVEDIIKSLGKNDEDTEKRMVEDAINLVGARRESAVQKCLKYSGFSVKLSLLVGVLLVILLL